MTAKKGPRRPKVLTFDVYGTVVDWRTTIIREGSALHPGLDWPAIADARSCDTRELGWRPFDALQRLMLDEVLARLNCDGTTDGQRQYLAELWSRMDPWPDVTSGLNRLKRDFVIAPLSNGSVWQLVSIAKHADLPWDLVLSVEMFRAYQARSSRIFGCARTAAASAERGDDGSNPPL